MRQKIQWGRLLRRAAALFLATLAVWVLPLCTGAGAASALRELGENPQFVAAALQAELGLPSEEGPLAALD
ncbi:stage II sporulation protein P, partial [Pseudoflavonifractor phocaeensis]|nr:stage II sporulation protein P [Pseudoflavonifractor phocaeensis]